MGRSLSTPFVCSSLCKRKSRRRYSQVLTNTCLGRSRHLLPKERVQLVLQGLRCTCCGCICCDQETSCRGFCQLAPKTAAHQTQGLGRNRNRVGSYIAFPQVLSCISFACVCTVYTNCKECQLSNLCYNVTRPKRLNIGCRSWFIAQKKQSLCR